MFKKTLLKLSRSIVKLILPLIYKILVKLNLNRRVINFLSEKSYFSNNSQNFNKMIEEVLDSKKIIELDIGAQGGFNSDNFFSKKYEHFFKKILVEPINSEAKKLDGDQYTIDKGLWSKKETKKLYLLGNRLGSSSMYEPDESTFDLHDIKKKDSQNFKITNTEEIECDTIFNILTDINVENLDYLKIDTQGAEFEILKGLGKFRPLLIKVETHIFSMYKGVPSWNKLLNLLYEFDYVLIDWKEIGGHKTRVPAEMDLIFIPNFREENGKNLIINSKEKFISLLLIFGQIELLKIICKRLKINLKGLDKLQDLYFN